MAAAKKSNEKERPAEKIMPTEKISVSPCISPGDLL